MLTKLQQWNIINSAEKCYLFFNLYERWQDEKQYEDIKDYLKRVQQDYANAYKVTKRPFAFFFKCSDGNLKVSVKKQGGYIKLSAESVV